ncbi:SIS domain-containing protein [Leucobacter aridicollis]|uniref:Glutamine--fructose-6-phosphate aminotransferase [isomerizing] n=1 Tax=Leucobacter aridicollis TaxID=283878 RepID=A0A852QT65_9MICO|nr:sugar isomerase [Leucobacter aridicollis]NYD25403.1 fructoselysine-6-P-deglycase FrlB-like protein [Leucobacter aridicollis]
MNNATPARGAMTRAELTSQPEIWTEALSHAAQFNALLPQPGERVLVLGCGTSYYMGDAYAYLRNDAGLGRTRAAIPRELNWVDDDEHIVVISRSGTTADVIALVEKYRDTHRITALLGGLDTELGRLCEGRVVDLGFADEQSVVQTRFATTGLTALRNSLGLVPSTLIDDAHAALAAALPMAPGAVRQVVFLGHRWSVGLAHEAALKVRESAGFWTEAYSVWEYEHGPISCAGEGSLVWFLDEVPEKVVAKIAATGAQIYSNALDAQANLPLAHRLAVELAEVVGRDPDTPPHLNRSVLVVE